MTAFVARKGDAKIIIALAGGATMEAAAAESGVSVRTVQRRLSDAGFRTEIGKARANMFEQAAGELAAGAVQASRRLQELLASGDNIALGAAKAILDSALRLRQSTELETRLTALEGHLGDNQESSSTTGTAGKQAA